MASDLFLYWGSGSVPCLRVMIALEEKGLHGYPNKMLSFDKQENKLPEVLAINPRGQLPAFRDGNLAINESLAACDYIEQKFKSQGTKLYPDDVCELGLVLQRKFESLNLFKKGNEEVIYFVWHSKAEDVDQELLKKKKAALAEELNIWEGYLAKEKDGNFIAGPNFSMADVILIPQLAFMVRSGLQLAPKWPKLAAYYDRVTARPSVKACWPPHWKDSKNAVLLADV